MTKQEQKQFIIDALTNNTGLQFMSRQKTSATQQLKELCRQIKQAETKYAYSSFAKNAVFYQTKKEEIAAMYAEKRQLKVDIQTLSAQYETNRSRIIKEIVLKIAQM